MTIKMKHALSGAKTILAATVVAAAMSASVAQAADIKLRLSTSATAEDTRAEAMEKVFAPMVSSFADFEGHWGSSLFKQGTDLEAIARGNLDMTITSAQHMAEFFPEYSIFSAGYVHRGFDHQKAVFNADFMDALKEKAENELNVKLLSVSYLGNRHVNLRTEGRISTPADLKGVRMRMPGSAAWEFLGTALGADVVGMAYGEVYTGLQTGAIDGQDNPLPNDYVMKFYEVTKQIALTGHLADLNYIAISNKVWDSLDAHQQAILQGAANAAAEYASAQIIQKEADLVDFFKGEGLDVYTPNLDAFRSTVQKAYLESDAADSWVPGMIDQINAL
ncbi:MAG: TRAP transporter substrate-binding protein DctP [Gammaproteobacteria bacterium]|nr:TRAP transporter substrate-binding protein DctP [Gammaproteobacteria bacterium]